MLFLHHFDGRCWICGSTAPLSGEHKIKRTDLIGEDHAGLGYLTNLSGSKKKKLQSLSSRHLKFPKSICIKCNGNETQDSDRAYDGFREQYDTGFLEALTGDGTESPLVATLNLELGTATVLSRYFGKHLGCQLVYQKFPVPSRLSKFVAKSAAASPISVQVTAAPFIWQDDASAKKTRFSALGGAALLLGRNLRDWESHYIASFMNKGLQFTIRMDLSWLEVLELHYLRKRKRLPSRLLADKEEKRYLGIAPQS